jgi:hypothetical protein
VSWEEILAKLEAKFSSWTHYFFLSLGGSLLIKLILMAMPMYFFFVMEAPKNIIKKIINLQCSFLWGGAMKEKKWALVAWEKLCVPKSHGGLCIREPQHVGQVLDTMLWW